MALDLALLPDGGVPWLESTGEHADIVLSSRIRLARNIAGFNFSARERDGERLRILAQVRDAMPRVPSLAGGLVLRMDELSAVDHQVLRERHLVSRELVGVEGAGDLHPASAVVVSHDAGVMVNEEDHLRLQVFRSGFDIAGAEKGFPPTAHQSAFDYLRRENAHFTIHAGEAYGLPSIWEAIQLCGAERLGHGVRIVDDIHIEHGRPVLGRLAQYVRDRRIPLELCPTSNVHTAAAPSIGQHPIGLLKDLRFRVTVNTDNRLMSDTSMSNEFQQLHDAFGWGLDDFEWVTINAMKRAFAPFPERLDLINRVIKPGYAAARAASA